MTEIVNTYVTILCFLSIASLKALGSLVGTEEKNLKQNDASPCHNAVIINVKVVSCEAYCSRQQKCPLFPVG